MIYILLAWFLEEDDYEVYTIKGVFATPEDIPPLQWNKGTKEFMYSLRKYEYGMDNYEVLWHSQPRFGSEFYPETKEFEQELDSPMRVI